jgi:DHA1 family inner membrane transport protein
MTKTRRDADLERPASQRLDKRIFLLATAIFATATDSYVLAGIIPAIAQSLHVSVGLAGQLATAYAVIFAFGSPIAATVSANWRHQRVVITCLLVFALAAGLSATAPGIIVLAAARILAACSSATYNPVAFGIAATLAPLHRRGSSIAVLGFGAVCAQLFGVPFGTWVAEHAGWRVTFAVDMGMVLLSAAVLRLAGLPQIAAGPSPNLHARLAPLTNPKVIAALIPSVLWTAAYYSIFFYIAVLFGPKLGAESVPWLLMSAGVGGLVGNQSGGQLADRFGPVIPIIGCLCVSTFVLALLNLASNSFAETALALFVYWACAWALFPLLASRLLALEPNYSTLVLSLNNSAGFFGLGCGAALGASALTFGSAARLPYVSGATMIASIFAFLVSLKFPDHHSKMRPSS